MPDPAKPNLRATYTSPSNTKVFTIPLSAPIPSSDSPTAVSDKVTYLSELRFSNKELQADLNAFLTQKMEEDRASAAVDGQDAVGGSGGEKKNGGQKSTEELLQEEEEGYGEEEDG